MTCFLLWPSFVTSNTACQRAACFGVFLVYKLLLSTLSDLVGWVLQGSLHQRMGAILISSSPSPVCARGPNSCQLCDATFSAHLRPQWDLSACREQHKGTVDKRDQNVRHATAQAPFLSIFLYQLSCKLKMYWFFFSFFHLICGRKEKFNFRVSGYLLFRTLCFSFLKKKQAVVFNQCVINY